MYVTVLKAISARAVWCCPAAELYAAQRCPVLGHKRDSLSQRQEQISEGANWPAAEH